MIHHLPPQRRLSNAEAMIDRILEPQGRERRPVARSVFISSLAVAAGTAIVVAVNLAGGSLADPQVVIAGTPSSSVSDSHKPGPTPSAGPTGPSAGPTGPSAGPGKSSVLPAKPSAGPGKSLVLPAKPSAGPGKSLVLPAKPSTGPR